MLGVYLIFLEINTTNCLIAFSTKRIYIIGV